MTTSFHVRRLEPEIIRPASRTPSEYKHLADFDARDTVRRQTRILLVYRSDPEKMDGVAPFLKDGLSRALVFFYPLAGRLAVRPDRKLAVECTGEGVLFIEGEAEFSVEELAIQPHGSAPYYDELIHDVPGSGGIFGCPLLLVQVTRLKSSGFAIGVRLNHAVMDAIGIGLFLRAVGEMAHGAAAPSVLPVWQRELLSARNPPQVTQKHLSHDCHEYEAHWGSKTGQVNALGPMISRSFVFGTEELAAIRRSLPENLRDCSTFELLASFLWRSRVVAFDIDPEDEVRFMTSVNIRNRVDPPLPKGYYGNAVIATCAITAAGTLRTNPLEYAISLVRKAKFTVGEEFVRSYTDLTTQTEQSWPAPLSFYIVVDLTKTGLATQDFGWGKPAFLIPEAIRYPEGVIGAVDFCTLARENDGEERVMVPMIMPEKAMERLARLIADLRTVKSCRL